MSGERTRWIKGVSGNPGGRPAVPKDIRDAAQRACPDAIKALTEIVRDKEAPPSARVSAASTLLDRGYGKPTQTINASTATKRPSDMTREELDAAIDAAMAARDEEAAEDDAPEPERLN